MKKIYSFFLALFAICTLAQAQVTITPTDVTGSSEGISFSTAKNDGTTNPTVNANFKDLRIYAKGSITIQSTAGSMKAILFKLSEQGKKRLTTITPDNGAVATQAVGDSLVKWTGDATSVTFTVGEKAIYGSDGDSKAGQLCIEYFIVSFDGTIPEPGPGPEPEPVDTTFYTTIADMQTAAAGLGTNKVVAKYTFNELIVTGVKDKNIYVTDGQRGLLIYGTNSKKLKVNDHITGALTGELQLYKGVTEFGNAKYDAVTLTGNSTAAVPVSATIADVTNDATKLPFESMLVKITGLTISGENNSFTGTDDSENTIIIYDQYSVGLGKATFLETEEYDVTAIVGNYNGTVQLYPRSLKDIEGNFEKPEPALDPREAPIDNPYAVSEFVRLNPTSTSENLQKDAWLKGYIVGYINGNALNANTAVFSAEAPADTIPVPASNILLAETPDANTIDAVVPVNLKAETAARNDLNLKDHPEMLGKPVWIFGDVRKYMGVAGLRDARDYSLNGETTGINAPAVAAPAAGEIFNIAGQRISKPTRGLYIVGGRKVIVK